MYAVGRIGSYISRGVDTVAAPFHPFGGAVDMIVVQQADGSLRSSPWYVRFGKFQGVLKTKEKVVSITVNGVDADFHMYLNHKGEAYFLDEVSVEEQEAVIYHSSSGEDTDKQSRTKRFTKSDESFDAEVKQPNSARLADGRDECKRELGAWSNSRRARILGLVFGSRSFKDRTSQESPEDEELKRARLLERAEIAADLLELKWSTTLATKRPKKKESDNDPVVDEQKTQASSIVSDKTELGNDHGELVNGAILMDPSDSNCVCTRDIVGTTELTSGVKSPMQYSVFVAQNSSDSLEIPGTKENVGGFEDDLSSENPDGSNMILDPTSVIGIRLVTHDSVDTEMSEVIHPADVVISRIDEDGNTKMEDTHLSGYFSRQTSSCSSCISEEEVVEPEITTAIDQSCCQTNCSESCHIEEAVASSPYSTDQQCQIDNIKNPARSISSQTPSVSSNEDQFFFSDLDDSKLTEVRRAESTSTHSKSGATCRDGHSPKEVEEFNNRTYELSSSSDNLYRQKVMNHLEEHQRAGKNEGDIAGSAPNRWLGVDHPEVIDLQTHCHSLDSYTKIMLPDEISRIQKSAGLSKSDIDFSVTDIDAVLEESRGDHVSSKVVLNSSEGVSPEAVDDSGKSWGIWPFTFKRSRSMKSSKPVSRSPRKSLSCNYPDSTSKPEAGGVEYKSKVTQKKMKTFTPTSEQLASLSLKEGRNEVTFTFSTAMLGDQQVDAKIYVWKWNARIVISDVDGTITRSDVLGQVMPLVGMDWSHIGVTQLFSAIQENGYQMLFLSARAISQAYHTKQFLFNLKQNGQALPDGPVVISPDGLFPSLFREVIRRAPHEFKIACLEDIKACFPPDCNPFYAGFGNRDTDEFSYLKVGIPKGKIFIINPKGEVAVHRRLDTKSYTSLHALVNDIFPPTSTTEQEDFNSWNFWKLPPLTL